MTTKLLEDIFHRARLSKGVKSSMRTIKVNKITIVKKGAHSGAEEKRKEKGGRKRELVGPKAEEDVKEGEAWTRAEKQHKTTALQNSNCGSGPTSLSHDEAKGEVKEV